MLQQFDSSTRVFSFILGLLFIISCILSFDVATFEEPAQEQGVVQFPASPYSAWIPPAPIQTVPFQPTSETVEISIFSSEAGPTLVGAIELIWSM
jgi:hypothetical protein